MHLYYCFLVSIISCEVFVYSQDELSKERNETTNSIHSNVSGNSGRMASTKNNNKPKSCTGHGCEHTGLIIASIFGILLFGFLLFKIFFIYRKRRLRGWPSRNMSCLATRKVTKPCEESVFQSGSWSARYLQLETWHGPSCYSLSFDPISFKITGSGSDDIGTFAISGAYAKETGRILLIKTYQLGTGEPSKNFGQRVWIRLTWNETNSQFEGTWLVRTRNYSGKDRFELKYHAEGQVWTVPDAK